MSEECVLRSEREEKDQMLGSHRYDRIQTYIVCVDPTDLQATQSCKLPNEYTCTFKFKSKNINSFKSLTDRQMQGRVGNRQEENVEKG